MLRPLLCLCALIALTGAQWSYQQTFNESSVVNISSCPITYYGQQYEKLYVNITSGNVTVCFNGFFSPETGGDCVVEHSLGAQQFYYNIILQPSTADVDYVLNLTSLSRGFLDISGCRHSGQMYRPGTVISSDPQTCFSFTCNETAVLNTSSCGALERCQGNGICTLDTMLASTCTFTGPTIIDVHGQINSIQDRCAYSLFSTPSLPDFLVLGNFRDRRRKDVSFLDSVTLRVDRHYIHLEQGGRVQLDDSTLTLSSSPQLVHGVQLSKDQTGVTAELSNLNISVFFDGYTAQILLEGPAGSSVEGLCGNSSSSLSDLRLSEYSSTSCEMQYSEPADTTINCTSVTERCNLLKEAPFSSCNTDIDPEPYITACTDTLCKYPAVDGLNCQFLKAYARACSQHNHTLDGWTSKTGCSSEAFCQDRTCSEFCGEKTVSGDTRCVCRAIFASKYQANNSLGDPTVCMQDSASVTLVGCLLADKGINYSALHLNDPTCRGQVDELTHMVTFGFNSSNSCGTVVTTNNSQVIYKNTIMTQNSSSDIINGHDQVYIDFSCVQTQADIKTATFRIRDSSVIQHITSGVWDYTLTMCATTDVGHTQAVQSSTEVQLIQKIRVELKTDGLDGDVVVVVTDSCWATDQPSTNSTPRYDLIINGCANPADQTVQVEDNGLGTSNYFSFSMFQFTGSSGEVYLHCELHLCPKQNNCVPTCPAGARRRRSARSKYEGEAFISMAWTH
uniref:Alpha-tectorin-like n=1 Tax=Maylandia zebra TaxID=106582 RepID=A0A3P9DI84_9CICH